MNAPLPESVLKALASLSLEDKYAQEQGRVFMSGIQALVRLPMLQHTRDTMAGLHTAGFISGYRGSPLGGYDQALWKARDHLEAHNVVFQPGVNEELGATAVWGTQQLDLYPEHKRFDGVFGRRLARAHHAVDVEQGFLAARVLVDVQRVADVGADRDVVDVEHRDLVEAVIGQLLQQLLGDLLAGLGVDFARRRID